ncbi:MAG: hypothetical protein H6606_07625 [Flavobacteriales bacterium]|nr:hypothetical protein [Flavobacteriales bacterium]
MKRWQAVGGSILLFTVLLNLSNCGKEKQSGELATVYLNHGDSAHYVGIDMCGKCHADKLGTFLHTGMGMSFDTASRVKSSAHFGQGSLVYDSTLDYFYRPFWRDDQLFIEEFRLIARDTIHKRTERIDYIVGSGQHTNSHLMFRGGYLYQAPITFYTQKGTWDLAPGFESGNNSRFTRIIDSECMGCHNAMPETDASDERRFLRVGRGIDCERCHGPGSLHVAFRSGGGVPEGDFDPTIVNPSDLGWERQMDLCQRCHLQGNNVLRPGKRFEDYRPGMRLSDVFEIYLPKYSGDQSLFNMANHSDRLQMSACFRASNITGQAPRLTCITCHNPHVSVRETRIATFNASCANCHGSNCKEERSVRIRLDDNCVGCHMPSSSAEDIPHVTVHDHKIGVHRDTKAGSMGSAVVEGLYSVNNPDPDIEMQIRAYLTYFEKFEALDVYRKKARGLLDQHTNQALEIHYAYQTGDWDRIVKLSGQLDIERIGHMDAYRVAEGFAGKGMYKQSAEWFELALRKAPNRFEYLNRYGNVLVKMGNHELARSVLTRALEINPTYKHALSNLAFVEMESGQLGKAEYWLKKCLGLDPDFIPAIENSIRLSLLRRDRKSALEWVNTLRNIDPNNIQAVEVLKELKQ